jgi:hypothetical protein
MRPSVHRSVRYHRVSEDHRDRRDGAHLLGLPPGVVAGLKLGEQFYRWLRSPNRAVAQLFERAAEPAPRPAPLAPVTTQDRDKLPDLSALDPWLLGMLALGRQ